MNDYMKIIISIYDSNHEWALTEVMIHHIICIINTS